MKLFLTSAAVLLSLSLCKAETDDLKRVRPQGFGGGDIDMGGRLQTMKDTKCPIFLETFDCDKDAPTDCTIDKPERPDKEDFEDLSDEEKAQIKSDIRGKMTEFKEKMQKCVCCNVISVEDIIAAKEEEEAGEGFRLFDSREGETGGMSEGEDGGFGGGRPSSSSMMSGTSGEGEGEGRPSGMSGGRPTVYHDDGRIADRPQRIFQYWPRLHCPKI